MVGYGSFINVKRCRLGVIMKIGHYYRLPCDFDAADMLIFSDDIVHRCWTEREASQTMDSPALLKAMIVALAKENRELRRELDEARDDTGG